MHQEPTTISPQLPRPASTSPVPASPDQHGLLDPSSSRDDPDRDGAAADGQLRRRSSVASSASSRSASSASSGRSIDARRLELLLPALRGTPPLDGRRSVPGQRVIDYESAPLPGSQRRPLGFRVVARSPTTLSNGARAISLGDFPNEILTHIVSHLHPDSLPAVAVLSKRFYALVTSPHAWRMAFFRNFPGQEISPRSKNDHAGSQRMWDHGHSDTLRSETRSFGRLTANATWRSEYMLRTRLLRSLARGKPGRGSKASGDKSSGVLTYGTKLPWVITHLDVKFSDRKVARAFHGSAEAGICTASDPTSGKLETWGILDQFAANQLNVVFPDLDMYGLGEGPVAVPNVMDVSQDYGMVVGEGFPAGGLYYRGSNDSRGFLLNQAVRTTDPDIPTVPHMSQGVSSVWIAKSPAVPNTTGSIVGIMTGSTLGVVTTYSLGWDRGASWFVNGDVTARWVVCPGVPIIALKVDENYSIKRRNARRVWAVALNALGEVYYLSDAPKSPHEPVRGNLARNAWLAGRSVGWTLVEATRRQANPDSLGDPAEATRAPRSSCDAQKLSRSQLEAEARLIERYFQYPPSHFRNVCRGWEVRRRLEVDFGGDDGRGGGEAAFVMDCGHSEGFPLVRRYTRRVSGEMDEGSSDPSWPNTTPQLPDPSQAQNNPETTDDWLSVPLKLAGGVCTITASALDSSIGANQTLAESAVKSNGAQEAGGMSLQMFDAAADVPGRRARLLAIGFDNGSVRVWDARATTSNPELEPLRVIRTDSPEVSCLAVSALYVVHGGSDGLAQAWDPLASTLNPIKVLNTRSSSTRFPRQLAPTGLVTRTTATSAVGAIHLDPNPTVLRGITAFGPIIKSWSYSSGDSWLSRKRKTRRHPMQGDVNSRRLHRTVGGHIFTEERELRHEKRTRDKEEARLRNRFGVGLGDLTEHETVLYTQMMSEESFAAEEVRRSSPATSEQNLPEASAAAATAGVGSTPVSRSGSTPARAGSEDGEFELQMQRAMRLSLLDAEPTAGFDSPGREFSVKFAPRTPKTPKNKKPFRGTLLTTGRSTSLSAVDLAVQPTNGRNGDNDDEFERQMQHAMELSLLDSGVAGFDPSPVDAGSKTETAAPADDTVGLGITLDGRDLSGEEVGN